MLCLSIVTNRVSESVVRGTGRRFPALVRWSGRPLGGTGHIRGRRVRGGLLGQRGLLPSSHCVPGGGSSSRAARRGKSGLAVGQAAPTGPGCRNVPAPPAAQRRTLARATRSRAYSCPLHMGLRRQCSAYCVFSRPMYIKFQMPNFRGHRLSLRFEIWSFYSGDRTSIRRAPSWMTSSVTVRTTTLMSS
jgi:hypothetical protein